MITKLLTPIGRRETLWAATIVIVPMIVLISFFSPPVNAPWYGAFALLIVCYYLSAIFVGDRIVKIVLRDGNKLFWLALAWAIISHILAVAVTSLVVSFFGIPSTNNYLLLLGMTFWYLGLLTGFVSLLPMVVAILYYWKQLEKITSNAVAVSSEL